MPYPKKSVNVYEETLERELCLYDWERQRLHTLNPTAALVWQQCDGQTSPAEIAARLEVELSTPHADKLVWLTLDRLAAARLLETKPELPANHWVRLEKAAFKRVDAPLVWEPRARRSST